MRRPIVLLAVLTACSAPAREAPTAGRNAQANSTFDIGRAATPGEIAALDIDVRPDGAGLPAGSGTARSGSSVYATQCASCHGAAGEGTQAGAALVGRMPNDAFNFGAEASGGEARKTVGSYWPYATTLYDYVNRAMPFDRPGSLSADQLYSVVAWMLWKNQIIAEDFRIDRNTLPAVRMPARDRFVPDDRERFKVVR